MSPTLTLRPLATLRVEIDEPLDAGRVPGGRRLIIPITGGTVTGRINGSVVPGGADRALLRADGTSTVSATYPLRTDDGTLLSVTNQGTLSTRDGGLFGVTAIRIEAPEGPWSWLNDVPIVGTLLPGEVGRAVDLAFYTVEPETTPGPRTP